MAKDSQVNGFFNFDNGAVKASKVELSPTPNEQVVGVSEKLEIEEGAKEMKTAVKTGMGFVVDEDVQLKWTTPGFKVKTGGEGTGKPRINYPENVSPNSTPTYISMAKQEGEEGKGRGKDTLLEAETVIEAVKSGRFYQTETVKPSGKVELEESVGTLAVQRFLKAISPAGTTVGTSKAARIAKQVKEEGLPVTLQEWQEWHNSQNKAGE